MSTKGPIALDVVDDGMGGVMCAKGMCMVYLDKLEVGPKIGTRATYRHLERHPVCETVDLRRVTLR